MNEGLGMPTYDERDNLTTDDGTAEGRGHASDQTQWSWYNTAHETTQASLLYIVSGPLEALLLMPCRVLAGGSPPKNERLLPTPLSALVISHYLYEHMLSISCVNVHHRLFLPSSW